MPTTFDKVNRTYRKSFFVMEYLYIGILCVWQCLPIRFVFCSWDLPTDYSCTLVMWPPRYKQCTDNLSRGKPISDSHCALFHHRLAVRILESCGEKFQAYRPIKKTGDLMLFYAIGTMNTIRSCHVEQSHQNVVWCIFASCLRFR